MKKWLVINYHLPSEPSRLRVATWRSLKKMGAVNIQQSMWILPYSEENYANLAAIAAKMEEGPGDSLIMESTFREARYENKVIDQFNQARKIEYDEIIDKCQDFFSEIEKEIARRNFTFAEEEENEEELAKLISWFEKIKARDLFGAPLRRETENFLEKCQAVFEDFSFQVYKNEKRHGSGSKGETND